MLLCAFVYVCFSFTSSTHSRSFLISYISSSIYLSAPILLRFFSEIFHFLFLLRLIAREKKKEKKGKKITRKDCVRITTYRQYSTSKYICTMYVRRCIMYTCISEATCARFRTYFSQVKRLCSRFRLIRCKSVYRQVHGGGVYCTYCTLHLRGGCLRFFFCCTLHHRPLLHRCYNVRGFVPCSVLILFSVS